jgi:predicted nucleic acid-binding protein
MTCVDTNVILEILLKRPMFALAKASLISCESGGAGITSGTISTVMYYAEINKLELVYVENYLRSFTALGVTADDCREAFNTYLGNDYEDALLVATALRNGCDKLITFDRKLFKKYQDKIKITLLS